MHDLGALGYPASRIEAARRGRYGDETPEERLWRRVDRSGGLFACWPWTGPAQDGYGVHQVGKTRMRAHVEVYTRLVGPVPDGLELDHLCRNTVCCNPSHLEPVTKAVNAGRANTARALERTTCKRGHPFDPDVPVGERHCRICPQLRDRREYMRAYNQRVRHAA